MIRAAENNNKNIFYDLSRSLWTPLLATGLGIILFTLVYGIYNSFVVSDYLSNARITRETAGTGSILAQQKSFIESTAAWLPNLEFLGLGLIFTSLAFALSNILFGIRESYDTTNNKFGLRNLDAGSVSEKIYLWVLAGGLLILLSTLIAGLYQSSLAAAYWNNSIIAELDPAPAGSAFSTQLSTIESIRAILQPLRFLGLGAVLSAAALVAFAVHRILRAETLGLIDVAESQSKKMAA